MKAGRTVTPCVRQERTQHRGAGRQISSAWCLGEVEEGDNIRFLFAMEILPRDPAFVKFEVVKFEVDILPFLKEGDSYWLHA